LKYSIPNLSLNPRIPWARMMFTVGPFYVQAPAVLLAGDRQPEERIVEERPMQQAARY